MKRIKRILFGCLILLCLFIGIGFIIAYLYEDEVKTYVVDEINKQLIIEVKVGDIDFSILRKFPYASLVFSDVICLSPIPPDTLFIAKEMFLQFNVLDIFSKNYRIKRIHVNDGFVNIRFDKEGNDNFHIWKDPSPVLTSEKGGAGFSFEINELIFDKVLVLYLNQKTKQDISFDVDNVLMTGKFASANYSLYANCNLFVHYIKTDSIYHFEEKPLIAEFELIVNNNNYQIESGVIEIADLAFEVSGNFIHGKPSNELDIVIKGEDLDIQTILSILPQNNKIISFIENIGEVKGGIDINSLIKWKYDEKKNPSIEISFVVNNGEALHDSTGFTLDNIKLKGVYSNGNLENIETNSIEVQKFSASIGEGNIKANFRIDNFLDPTVSISIISKLRLADLYPFLKADTIQSIEGDLIIDASFKGEIKKPDKYTSEDIKAMEISGIMELINVKVQLKGNPLEIYNINGSLVFNDDDIFIEDLIGEVSPSREENYNNQFGAGTDFQLGGYFKNILSYIILPGQKLFVQANLKSKNINMDELLKDYSTSTSSDTSYTLTFPDNIDFNLIMEIDKLVFRKFKATGIKGVLKLKDKKLVANSLSFAAMDGQILANGVVDGTYPEKLLVTCDAVFKKIDIKKLFYEFENFGQDVMQDEHLKGVVTADIQFASVWSRDLVVDIDKIYTKADLTITKGELIKFKPMMELSKFIDLSELENIKFSTLQNQIEIRNKEVYIPKMEIKSSVLSITASGVHTFNNEVNYKFKVFLPELLAKKAKKAKKENNEFGIIQDDGLGITLHLSMTGTVDDLKIKYDRKEAIKTFREDLKSEKQTLKAILNEEFGWFKKDTTLNNKKEEFDDDYFIIEWDEDAPEEEIEED